MKRRRGGKEGKKKRRNKGRRKMFPKHTYKEICHFLENRNISDLRLLEEGKKKKRTGHNNKQQNLTPLPIVFFGNTNLKTPFSLLCYVRMNPLTKENN